MCRLLHCLTTLRELRTLCTVLTCDYIDMSSSFKIYLTTLPVDKTKVCKETINLRLAQHKFDAETLKKLHFSTVSEAVIRLYKVVEGGIQQCKRY